MVTKSEKPTGKNESPDWNGPAAKAPITGADGTQSADKRKWTEVADTFFKFEKIGDSLTGRIAEKTVQKMRNGEVGRYKIIRDDDELISFLGGTDVDDKMRSLSVGTYVRVTFVETSKTSSGNTMRHFKVETAS